MNRFVSFSIDLLYKCHKKLNPLTIMSYIHTLLITIETPFPTTILNPLLHMIHYIAPSFKGAVDNTLKGYFIEFLEYCQSLKGTGQIDDGLCDTVVNDFATVTFVCYLCLLLFDKLVNQRRLFYSFS